jgi:carboxypeptidase C (cathepsin A)
METGMIQKILIFVLAASILGSPALAAERKVIPKPESEAKTSAAPAQEESKGPSAPEKLSVTHQTINIQGQAINYTATAGRLSTSDESGKHKADIFFVAYTKDGGQDAKKRPITFAFNGGPGASSVWLHLGAIGPKRAPVEDGGKPSLPPYQYIDNEYSWLAFSDLVFIDPVGTGFSRPAHGEKEAQFSGIKGDIDSVGDFIRLYTSKYDRWLSPKFLVGESYGTFRAVGLSKYLFDAYGMNLNGLILISPALDFQTFSFGIGNDLPYVLALPSYTAAAWYWKKLGPELQDQELPKTLKEVEEWAMNDYVRILAKGSALSESERKEAVDKLALYTGLPTTFIETRNLRITSSDFRRELLKNEDKVLGILDSRASILARTGGMYSDPGLASTIAPYVDATNDYVKTELDYDTELPYIFLSGEANSSWDWGSAASGYPNMMSTMRDVMARSGLMRILIACGYYDLATPYLSAEYTVSHLGLNATLQKNIEVKRYNGGHQMYTNMPALKDLTQDAAAFEKAQPGAQ